MNSSEYVKLFITESEEYIEEMGKSLIGLEKDPSNADYMDSIFRVAHTIKGMAATMEYFPISDFAHKMENLLDRLRKKEISINDETMNILFECADTLESMVKQVKEKGGHDIAPPNPDTLSRLEAVLTSRCILIKPTEKTITESSVRSGLTEEERAAVQKGLESDNNIYFIKITISQSSSLKAARAYVVIRELGVLGNVVKSIPDNFELDDVDFGNVVTLIIASKHDIPKIIDRIQGVPDIENVDIKPLDTEGLLEKKKKAQADKYTEKIETIRVDVDRLDNIVNNVEELVINHMRIAQMGRMYELKELNEMVVNVEKLLSELQDNILKIRMVPVEHVLNRFPKMVRDISKKEGKEIELIMEGTDVEIDRTIIDELGEPLVHILRNCIDHGIEKPDERRKIGKRSVGTIKISAVRMYNNAIISIEDDGQGISIAQIKEIAVKKGFVSMDDIEKMSDENVFNLLFLPGLSSSDSITELSGRGVGLDVVKNKIELLGGIVWLEAEPGKGTKISLKLPWTIAIIKAMMIGVGDEVFAVPLESVKQICALKKNDVIRMNKKDVFRLREDIIPLIYLRNMLDIQSASGILEGEQLIVTVVESNKRKVGLVADSLIGQHEIVIKALDKSLKRIKGISGATILGDGNVSLILDVNTITNMYLEGNTGEKRNEATIKS